MKSHQKTKTILIENVKRVNTSSIPTMKFFLLKTSKGLMQVLLPQWYFSDRRLQKSGCTFYSRIVISSYKRRRKSGCKFYSYNDIFLKEDVKMFNASSALNIDICYNVEHEDIKVSKEYFLLWKFIRLKQVKSHLLRI